jgi:hypothetical protein
MARLMPSSLVVAKRQRGDDDEVQHHAGGDRVGTHHKAIDYMCFIYNPDDLGGFETSGPDVISGEDQR